MADSIPVDKLALMLGVDSNAMLSGFTSAAASSRAMTRALMEGMNRELEKGNQEAAENFAKMPQLLSAQFASHINAYKKHIKEIQDQERSISNAMIAGMSRFGRVDPVAAGMTAAFLDQKAQKESERLAEAERIKLAQLNQERIRAATLIHQIRRQQNEANSLNKQAAQILTMLQTPQEAHNARLAVYNTLLARGKINQDQHNKAVKQSEQVMRSSAAGMGKMNGVLAQLSFGIEDFAQGIAMGDLRSALLGASNNMTMVVRGLIDMKEGTTIAGMAVGKFVAVVAASVAATGGLAYYLNWLSQAKRDTRSLTDAIRDATMGFDLLGMASKNQTRIERERIAINRITSIEEINRKEQEHMLDQIDNEKELMRIRNESSVKASEIITNMMGGSEARVDVEKMLARLSESNLEDLRQQALETQKSLSNAQRAMAQGDAETTIREMRKVFEYLNSESTRSAMMSMRTAGTAFGGEFTGEDLRSIFFDRTALNALEEYFQTSMLFAGESDEKLRQLREEALKTKKELTTAEMEQNRLKAQSIDMELRRRELEAERIRITEQEFFLSQKQAEAQQKEVLFLITATDHQKEILRLNKEADAFSGDPGASVPSALGFGGIAGGVGGMMADMAISMAAENRRTQLLEAHRERTQKIEAERAHIMEQEFLFTQKQAEAQQKEILFLITATDHQKELLRLKKESASFGAAPETNIPGALGFGGIAGGIGGMMADMAANMAAEDRRVKFLEAQRQQLQTELNKLVQESVKPQGALQQNAFQAQADAFKQIVENANKQSNPQTTRIINLITSIDAALRNGGVIKVVP